MVSDGGSRSSACVEKANRGKVGDVTRRHMFVCTNERSSGKPACGLRGGNDVLAAVHRLLIARGATDVLVTPCGCLGPCFDGPNAVVYPDAVWYGALDTSDTTALVEHLHAGVVHDAKRVDPPGEEPPGEGPPGEDPPGDGA